MATLHSKVFEPVDFDLSAQVDTAFNPFILDLRARLDGPQGQQLEVPGFYKGDGTWCVRVSAPQAGEWRLTTLSALPELAGKEAVLQIELQDNPLVHGVVRVDSQNPLHFRHEDGTPFFLYGYEINWLWALGQENGSTAEMDHLLDGIHQAGFNYVLVNSYAYDTNWDAGKTQDQDYGPPALLPWLGSHGAHDYAQLNPAYWDHFDRMMWALFRRGMVAHIYFKVYNKQVIWPEKGSPQDRLWFDTITARYQAFPNLVWDYAKESYYEPDKDYMAACLQRIRRKDAYRHMTTVHDDIYFTYNDPWKQYVDFITDQNHHEFYQTLLRQREKGIGPVFNVEYGYEHGPGSDVKRTWGVFQTPEEVLSRTCEVLMAGAYPAYYYTNHAWDILRWDELPPTLPAYKTIYELFSQADWWNMVPRDDLSDEWAHVLTNGSDEMILFTIRDRVTVISTAAWAGTEWEGFWMDIRTGARHPLRVTLLPAGARNHYTSPFDYSSALMYLKRC
jgi:hypothetical protein